MTSAEVLEAYTRARDLCEESSDADHLFVALWNLWLATAVHDIDAARPLSNKLLVLTQSEDDSALRLQVHHAAWYTRFCAGEPAQAHVHCAEGRRLYDFERHRSHAHLYGGHDPGVCAHLNAAWIEWLLGYPDKALDSINDGVRLAEQLAHPYSLQEAFLYRAVLHLFRREPEKVLPCVRAGEELATEQRLALFIQPDILRSSALLAQGLVRQAAASLRESLTARQAIGQLHGPYQLALLAEVLERIGDRDRAACVLAEAEAAIDTGGQRWWEAEIHRLRGMLHLSWQSFTESEACFERALDVARQQQAKSLELRAATSLARLWRDQGKQEQAHRLLAPVYGWFTEGFDTPDLKETKVLLEELG
jgi:tetratricopeptide (TPR) repeat protein